MANILLISNKISINKNKQIYFFLFFSYFSLLIFYHKKPASFGWKPIPSNARVTWDEVSGFIKMTRMAVWKTVPYKLFRLRLTRHVQNLSRIKRMRRICSFTDFFIHLWFVCACRALWLSRIISCWRLSSAV